MPATIRVLCAVALPSALAAQQPQPPAAQQFAARVDSIVAPLIGNAGAASVSVVVTRGSETLVRRAWGVADLASQRAATDATTYRIGSTSKQFTAALVLRLVDRGRVSLGDTLGRYLTGLRPEWTGITIEQLLNHTSGLHREYRQPSRLTETLSTDTLIAFAARGAPLAPPGVQWAYSNTGYMLLGALVEKVYGKPYRDVLREEIAAPLGLTTLGWCNDTEALPGAARGYQRANNALTPSTAINPGQALGAGGICASAGDVAAWNRALHGGRVLSPASYAAMTTPRGVAAGEGYGFGIRAQRSAWGSPVFTHDGGQPGFLIENSYFPADSLSITVFYNTTPPPGAGQLTTTLARAALGLPLTGPLATPGVAAAPARRDSGGGPALEPFVGEYEVMAGRTITITLENGQLQGQPTGNSKRPLVHVSGTTFGVGSATAGLTLTFVVGPDGRAMAAVMRQGTQERTLQRVR